MGKTTSVTPWPAAYVTSKGTEAITRGTAHEVQSHDHLLTSPIDAQRKKRTWYGEFEPPADVEHVVTEPEKGGDE